MDGLYHDNRWSTRMCALSNPGYSPYISIDLAAEHSIRCGQGSGVLHEAVCRGKAKESTPALLPATPLPSAWINMTVLGRRPVRCVELLATLWAVEHVAGGQKHCTSTNHMLHAAAARPTAGQPASCAALRSQVYTHVTPAHPPAAGWR